MYRKLLLSFLFCISLAGSAMAQSVVTFKHIVLVLEENHSYSEIIGNSDAPYLNQLADTYGLATAYYANAHPSIGNYFWLTTGQDITNTDSFCGTVAAD